MPAEQRLIGVTLALIVVIWAQSLTSVWETLILTPCSSHSCIGAKKWQLPWPLSPNAL